MAGVLDRDVRECASVNQQEVIRIERHLTVTPEHAPGPAVLPPPPWTEVRGNVLQSLHNKYHHGILVALPPLWMGEVHIDIYE